MLPASPKSSETRAIMLLIRAILSSRHFEGIFYKPIGSSGLLCSASKSLILNKKTCTPELCPHFRRLVTAVAGVGHRESEFFAIPGATGGVFSERDFAGGFLCK
jgi:hypothetical protein